MQPAPHGSPAGPVGTHKDPCLSRLPARIASADERAQMGRKHLLVLPVVLIWLSALVFAQNWSGIIDPSRAIDWSSPGVAGGIPSRSTVCASLSSGSTVSQINSALANCPSGQVVLLGPGVYNTSGGTITIPSNVTLRGSGPSGSKMTQINLTGSGAAAVRFGNGSEPSSGNHTAITAGGTKGSTSITVSSTSGITAGKLLVVTQNDLSYMTENGDNGACGWCNGGIGGDSGQVVQVKAVNGTTLTIDPPLYISYSNAPQVFPYSAGCTSAGLENLTISANNTGYNPNILFDGVINSWVKNVESDFADGAHLYLSYSLHNTVRDSFFHDGFSHGPGGTDDQLGLQYKSSANLIENNIFWRQHVSVMLEWGASGNVIAYNYMVGNYDDNSSWQINDIDFHGAHPMMNLFEGNIESHFQPDSTWGSSSHSTIFRNYATGSNIAVPPFNARGTLQPGSGVRETANAMSYAMDWLSDYNNMVGVIAGSAYLVNSEGAPSRRVAPASGGANPACVNVGYQSASSTSGSSNNTDSTMFYHGVYNCTDGSFQWANGITQTLPSSLYLSSAPSWWGNVAWPPIGPDVTGGNITDSVARGHFNAIPAMSCFNNATANGTTNVSSFDASTCYSSTSSSGNVTPPSNLVAIVN
jgi:hypothetical protein